MTFSNRVLCVVVVDPEQNTGEDQCIQTAHRINGNVRVMKLKKEKRKNKKKIE